MPLKKIHRFFFGKIPNVSLEEAMKVFKRDHFKCQYCGLDGLASFENWMVMTVDHIHAYAKGGSPAAENQVTACQPCNTIKGTRDFTSLGEAKKYVQAKRAEWHEVYREQAHPAGHPAGHVKARAQGA
ncbi:MAG: HNH endonuclease [Terriglobia bacterium]